jgi:hypothetical protein
MSRWKIMTVPIEARLVDLANLIVAKGSNFLLTVVLFALISRGMDSHAFGEFGYWWSIAIMIGGVLLGGLSSALVRVAAVHGSLRHLLNPLRHAAIGLLAVALVWSGIVWALPQFSSLAFLMAAVGLFGLSVQAQTAVLSLLRAAEATRTNAVASTAIVMIVPLFIFFWMRTASELPQIFFGLAVAFAIGTITAMAISSTTLSPLWTRCVVSGTSIGAFVKSMSSFTAVNIFSYAVVNIDFTLFRLIGTPEDFAVMASAKVFFERFVVPMLMVFSGAISLRVLRHPHKSTGSNLQLSAHINFRFLLWAIATVLLLVGAYWVFTRLIRADAVAMSLFWVACASAGYLLYAVNGMMLDVLVVQHSLATVVKHIVGFLLLSGAVQGLSIATFGVPGWALGWLCINLVVAAILSRSCLRLRWSSTNISKQTE